eukprot:scaffold142_cov208-Chaetoceros_neogracile.AAC.4
MSFYSQVLLGKEKLDQLFYPLVTAKQKREEISPKRQGLDDNRGMVRMPWGHYHSSGAIAINSTNSGFSGSSGEAEIFSGKSVVGDSGHITLDISHPQMRTRSPQDGTGKSWYRATVLERKPGKAKVLFVDHGNVATLPVATRLRPLDVILGTNRIPPVAKEAALAAIKTRGLDDDDGLDAARLLQTPAWRKEVLYRVFCQNEGKLVVALYQPGNPVSISEQIVSDGLARVSKATE